MKILLSTLVWVLKEHWSNKTTQDILNCLVAEHLIHDVTSTNNVFKEEKYKLAICSFVAYFSQQFFAA